MRQSQKRFGDQYPSATAANPKAENNDGYIIKVSDSDDHVGTNFTWDHFLIASITRGTSGN